MKHASFAVRMLAFWAVAAFLFVGCSESKDTDENTPPEPTLEKLILDKEALTLQVGDQYTFEVTLSPEGVQNVELTWATSDSEVVSVDAGTVTALSEGEATVTVNAGEISASCRVTVDDGIVEVESVTLSTHRLELNVGGTSTLEATVNPADAVYEKLTWESSDAAVAKVDDKGLVTALAVGEATIQVTAGECTDECVVVVSTIPVESVTLNFTELELEEGDHFALMATVLPDDATDKGLTWASLDEEVATVDNTGLVKAQKAGQTTITATAGSCTAECHVVVNAPEVTAEVKVGDYFYSDGTYSSELQSDKTVIGVVFYAGDATVSDAALARDHAACTHGLVVSIADAGSTSWQSGNATYGATVSSWIESNLSDYAPILTSGDAANAGNFSGYNNTQAIKAFNAAAENASWPVEVIQGLDAFAASHAAPATTSGWFVPSASEMWLLISGTMGNFEASSSTANLKVVNGVLENIPGASTLAGPFGFIPGYYQTSSEVDATQAFQLVTIPGGIMRATKTDPQNMRPILAF